MKVLSAIEAAQEIARGTGKPVLYISGLVPGPECEGWIEGGSGRLKAAPYLDLERHSQAAVDGAAIVICEDEEEQMILYELTYGDDGLTKSGRAARRKAGYPPYEGQHRVYALAISATGETLTENT